MELHQNDMLMIREHGRMTSCQQHGFLADMRALGQCNACIPRPLKSAVNINCISTTLGIKTREGSRMDGTNGRPFIGEYISEWIVDTQEVINDAAIRMQREHQSRVDVNYL